MTFRLPLFELSILETRDVYLPPAHIPVINRGFYHFFGRLKQNDRGKTVVLITDAGPRGLRWISSIFAPCSAVPNTLAIVLMDASTLY